MTTRSHDSNLPLLPALGRLVVYRKALALAQVALALPVQGPLADQLARAAQSLALNIAEGAGERSAASKRRYYAIARGSLYELAAALDLATVAGPARGDLQALLGEVDRMLTTMVLNR